MTDHMVKAFESALGMHAETERYIARWEAALAASIFNSVTGSIAEKAHVSEGMKARASAMSQALAAEIVEGVPGLFSKAAGGASITRQAVASALTPQFMVRVTERVTVVAERKLIPEVVRRQKAAADAIPRAPMGIGGDAGPSMGIDLGAFARGAAAANAVHEAAALMEHRKANPVIGVEEGFVVTPEHIEGERAAADQVRVKGPAPSADRVINALAAADTVLETGSTGRYPAKPQKGKGGRR